MGWEVGLTEKQYLSKGLEEIPPESELSGGRMFQVEGTTSAKVLRVCLVPKEQQGGQRGWNGVSKGRVDGDEVRDIAEAKL